MGEIYPSIPWVTGEERIAIITHKLKFISDEHRIKVAYVRQTNPLTFIQDEYLDQVIRVAGGIPQSNPLDPSFAPEALVVISDKEVGTLLSELPSELTSSFWPETRAVKNNNVFIVYHPEHLRTPGKTPADDVEIMAEIINPGYFIFGRNEDAWLQFDLG